jgi:hypothetical protein
VPYDDADEDKASFPDIEAVHDRVYKPKNFEEAVVNTVDKRSIHIHEEDLWHVVSHCPRTCGERRRTAGSLNVISTGFQIA